MWEEGEHTLESCGRMGTEVKPLDLLVREGLKALATACLEHIKNLGEKQKLVSGQNKWHKALGCFHSS